MVNTAKLKGRLRELNRTQADLGQAVGLATATISQKINGLRPMTLDEAEAIAVFLGIPDAEFSAYFFKGHSA